MQRKRKDDGSLWRFPLLLLLLLPGAGRALELSLKLDDIAAPDFSARGIALILPQDGSAELSIAALNVRQYAMRGIKLRCASFELSSAGLSCRDGSLASLPGTMLDFSYRFGTGVWRFSSRSHGTPASMLAAFLPAGMPRFTQGVLHGALHASGAGSGIGELGADLRFDDVGFSDESGLRAAEKLRGALKMDALRKGRTWRWNAEVAWQSGEVFWQPLYLSGGRTLNASGSLDDARIEVAQATLDAREAGRVKFSALWDRVQGKLIDAALSGEHLALEPLFADYVRPFFDKSALAEAALSGHADVDWRYRAGATRLVRLTLRQAGLSDARRRFALHGVDTDIEWLPDAPRQAGIAFAAAELFGVPFGGAQWQVQMHGRQFGVARAVLPTLGGQLQISDFELRQEGDGWRWQFGAMLSNIPMEQFSQAMGWPKMLGILAGRIPQVRYDGKEISAEGALLFNVFDGTVVASQLRLADPFGRAPRLFGNLGMRGLDLDLLTRTFAFGNMQGRIDAEVSNLELQDWRPARFDARIVSSEGSYPRKISQKAVENISALGGAGAAAAIQRSYLRFFENFGYERIGWRCALRNGVCAMGGVAAGNDDPYVIVEGGGIPAITVMGYNRTVSWDELVSRLKRVTQNNVQAVVK